ncbi:MAG: site-specific integrase [Crocinitomicaceae bacterium]|nr:site-specific integrase [Crocinitomicaceae bacterium]
MKDEYFISIYLDTRRAKASGLYPVKLRVFTSAPRVQKLYPTNFELTVKDFESAWNTKKPRTEYKKLRNQLIAVEKKAFDVAEKLVPFTFAQFERQLFRNSGDGIKLTYHYNALIDELNQRQQIGTANTYDLSKKSLSEFAEQSLKLRFDNLTFFDITPKWLKDYEQYMTQTKKRSLTTVSMYLRVLRAIFNKAIEDKEIDKDFYPFGKRKYQVPATKNVKKALTSEQLNLLFQAEVKTKEQEVARDFWFFSFNCNGMNIKDIALLRYKDIQDGKIDFLRAKTKLTTKGNQKQITTYLNPFSKNIIQKYGHSKNEPEQLVFDILTENLSAWQEQTKIKNFTRMINQNLKKAL